MSRFRVFDPETANQLIPRITTEDTIDLISSGEYFSADNGDVILAPSVKEGDVLYIRIRSAAAPKAAPRQTEEPPSFRPAAEPQPLPPAAENPVPIKPESAKHYVASGFLGLDGDVEEETPEPPKPWWKRLID